MKNKYDFSKAIIQFGSISSKKVDNLLKDLADELVTKNKCHTVLLYGSRARGDANKQSDYDLMGIRRTGEKYRIARKQDGRCILIQHSGYRQRYPRYWIRILYLNTGPGYKRIRISRLWGGK